MATTKVIKDLTELNPGNPDYVLNATNAVTVINAGGNQYNFNGVYGKFGLRIGTTVLTGVPVAHPIAVLNNGLTGITYTGTFFNTLDVGGVTYNFYTGDVTITVTADFGVASYYCYYHGYMGGENNFVSVYSEAGLRMPSSNAAYSGPTVAEGMMRNEVGQVSESSASTMQHYNGTDWKNFVNKAVLNYNTDFLAVAGAGAGGFNTGGGGGAGGLLTSVSTDTNGGTLNTRESTLTLTAVTAYTITIGAGGSKGSLEFNTNGSPGGITTIAGTGITTITANGGGFGGSGSNTGPLYAGGTGASGGGGSRGGSTAIPGAAATNSGNQGFSGGASSTDGDSSGGGGGASQVGVSRPGALKGGANGGDGRISTIITTAIATSQSVGEVDGTDVYFSGGGGGGGFTNSIFGTGGTGGGKAGTQNTAAADGSPNTGGAGGGGAGSGGSDPTYTERLGGNGGSGVVILKVFTSTLGTISGTSNTSVSLGGGYTAVIFKESGTYTTP